MDSSIQFIYFTWCYRLVVHDVVAPAEKLCRYSLLLHHTFVPVVASLGKISKFSVVVVDADGVTWTGASRREYSGALAAPITFVRGLKVSKFFLKNGSDREIVVAKKDQPNAGSCEMQWKSIAGD